MGKIRIIAGRARGIRLHTVPGGSTRPITDRTKEALFNIIGIDIIDSDFLDLFAGTGSVGIEALSRGANFVRFIDNNRRAVETIKKNLQLSKLQSDRERKNAEIIHMDAFVHLSKMPDRKFDIIYIAPPQYKGMWEKTLYEIDNKTGWLYADAWIIVQIHPVELSHINLQNLTIFDSRKYGSTQLLFYKQKLV